MATESELRFRPNKLLDSVEARIGVGETLSPLGGATDMGAGAGESLSTWSSFRVPRCKLFCGLDVIGDDSENKQAGLSG